MMTTMHQREADVWQLDKVFNIHVMVKHNDVANICRDILQAEQKLEKGGMKQKDLLGSSLRMACRPKRERNRRGLLQEAWGLIGSVLGLQQSPFRQQHGHQDWQIINVNQHQLQTQLRDLANQTFTQLKQLDQGIRESRRSLIISNYHQLITNFKTIYHQAIRHSKLLNNGWLPEDWQEAIAQPIQRTLQQIPKEMWKAWKVPHTDLPSEMARKVWEQIRHTKLEISVYQKFSSITEIVLHLPLTKQKEAFQLLSWKDIQMIPLHQNHTKVIKDRIEVWKVSNLEWFANNSQGQIQVSAEFLSRCMQLNQQRFCPDLTIYKNIDSCEFAVLNHNPDQILRKCEVDQRFQPEVIMQTGKQTWQIACAQPQPTAIVCNNNTRNLLCNASLKLIRLHPTCKVIHPNFRLQGRPVAWNIIKKVTIHQTHRVHPVNFSWPEKFPQLHLQDRPLQDALSYHYQDIEDKINQYWSKVIGIVSAISLLGLVAILIGILYCTIKAKLQTQN